MKPGTAGVGFTPGVASSLPESELHLDGFVFKAPPFFSIMYLKLSSD